MAITDLEIKDIEVEYVEEGSSDAPKVITLMITIVRGARGKRKLLGEAYVRTVYHPIIHFKCFDEDSVDSLLHRFLLQLIYRGYRPIQYRMRDLENYYSEWKLCTLDEDELSPLEHKKEGMDIGENYDDF